MDQGKITMIKNIIFDIGNVLVDFCWEEDFHNKGLEGEIFERVANATTRNYDWNEFDLGNLTHEEIIEKFIENDPELADEIRLATSTVAGMIRKRDYAEEIILKLKNAGYGVYILSNFSYVGLEEAKDDLTFIPLADGAVISCFYHEIKPYPEIYNILLREYNLNAPECVFLDDRLDNIEGAEKCGIRGIVFRDLDDALYKLKCMGVNI